MFLIAKNEKLTETKTCRFCQTFFPITDKDLEFYEKVSPIFSDKKYPIPPPTLCPDCRQQRRLSFRNERKLYKRTCDATLKEIVSIYSPDKTFKVYHQDHWWSDKWDPMSYGRDFDFSRPFFEQFSELMGAIPKCSLSNINCQGAEFNHTLTNSKNCYLCFGNIDLEDVLFATESGKMNNSADILWSYDIGNSYEISNSDTLTSCIYCEGCSGGHNCMFCSNCYNCKNCLFCYGLENKEYHILNKPYSRQEYERKLTEFLSVAHYPSKGREISERFFKGVPHRFINSFNIDNSSGDYIYHVKNVINGFNVVNVSDGRHLYECGRSNDIGDCSYVYDCEGLIFDTLESLKSYRAIFSVSITSSHHILYSHTLLNCSNCFGCTGLRNKSYCILNKQYTKEQYESLVPRIIEHMMRTPLDGGGKSGAKGGVEWGEFLMPSISPFGYNESSAEDHYPLTREEVVGKSHPELVSGSSNGKQNEDTEINSVGQPRFNWSDYESPFPKVEKIIPGGKLPDSIDKIPDDILNWAIECEISGKPFRIVKQELDFYRKHGLPIPRRHPDQRHMDRMHQRNPRVLQERSCSGCSKTVISTYAPCESMEVPLGYSPERPEVIYCEECYNREMVG